MNKTQRVEPVKHIFVVDDEKSIRDILKKYIENEGDKVTLFDNGSSVLAEITRMKPDLLVLDIMMPGVGGMELCKQIRKTSDVPIIFVSAKGEELDRVLGLELGADDYLTKPFSPRELVVRIKNIFKRLDKGYSASALVKLQDIELHPDRRLVQKEGQEIKLTSREFALFEFLAAHRNLPFTRDQLLQKVWGYDYTGDERLIDDLVKRIRKKLAEHDSAVQITTVWGYGYRLDA
ncbi:response regulator transcription factor [Paenibacillus sp. sptzw28]|uniref:response regulator transcription factor n=1 Tax=Paenibacillus sp. sptzw28 TaxID=715179 RepID=UPI001C6E3AF5|nr:response regulator transcription factor [Paenibacillus sp. sptzw28]QYR22989.1 response regulator transcription factor [Paenibacillus sp. sptzw28]